MHMPDYAHCTTDGTSVSPPGPELGAICPLLRNMSCMCVPTQNQACGKTHPLWQDWDGAVYWGLWGQWSLHQVPNGQLSERNE